MANAFFIFDANRQTVSGSVQQRDDKILPDPITLGVVEFVHDGKLIENTACSGLQQYLIVDPGDYPTTQDQRERRRGTVLA